MSRITYPNDSPYAFTPQTSWYLEKIIFRTISPDANDTLMALSSHHTNRPDILSYELYGTPNYWWVFCVRNAFLRSDPIWGFVSGITIVVPSAKHIQQSIGG